MFRRWVPRTPCVPPLGGAQGRHQHLAVHDDLAAVRGLQHVPPSVGKRPHDVVPLHRDDRPVGNGQRLTDLEADQPQPALARLLHVVPVRGRPHRRLLLALHHQPPARGLELPGAGAALLDHRLAAARCHLGREEDLPPLLVPEVPLLEADHQVGPIVRRLRRAFRVAQHPLGAGHAPARAVEDLEAILQHQAGHVAPEAHAHGMDEKRGTGRREGQHDPDELDGRPAAVAEETRDAGHELRILRRHPLAHVSGSTRPCRAAGSRGWPRSRAPPPGRCRAGRSSRR